MSQEIREPEKSVSRKAGGFVFVTPDFQFAAAYMTVNVGGFGLQEVAQSRASLRILFRGFTIRAQRCHLRF